MRYYQDEKLLIRSMIESDIQTITEAELVQGWHVESAKQEMRFQDQEAGRSFALIAEYDGQVAGYINLYKQGLDGPDKLRPYPEIVDFGVFIKFRRNGIGSKLMDIVERAAADLSDTVYLGVGVHYGYGSASGCMSSAATFLTAAVYGTRIMCASSIRTAATTTIWCSTCPRNCVKSRRSCQ